MAGVAMCSGNSDMERAAWYILKNDSFLDCMTVAKSVCLATLVLSAYRTVTVISTLGI